MLVVRIIIFIIGVKIANHSVYYKKISSRTAADPTRTIPIQIETLLKAVPCGIQSQICIWSSNLFCLQIRQIDFN